MIDESNSLERMHDIVTPEAIAAWPPAPGWYLVLVIGASLLAWFALVQWRRWRANAYRREAVRAVSAASSVPMISEVLRRVALVEQSRGRVASLSGTAWSEWLREQTPVPMSDTVADQLAYTAYRPADGKADSSLNAVRTYAVSWIRAHSAADDNTEGR